MPADPLVYGVGPTETVVAPAPAVGLELEPGPAHAAAVDAVGTPIAAVASAESVAVATVVEASSLEGPLNRKLSLTNLGECPPLDC